MQRRRVLNSKHDLRFFLIPLFVLSLLSLLLFKAKVLPRLELFLKSTQIFTVRNIECKTQYGPCPEEDLNTLNNFLDSSLPFLNTSEIKDSLQKNFKNRKAYVQKVFPHTLEIAIEKRRASVAIAKDSSKNTLFLVAQDGTVLALAEKTALPKLFLADTYKVPVVGERLNDKEIAASRILSLTYKVQNASSGQLHQDHLEVTLENSSSIYYSLDKDPEALVGALQLILARSKMEGRLPKIIDLRYSNPVLRY